MTIYTIPPTDWTTKLANTIKQCTDGDTIIIHNQAMKLLGARAAARMCPNKTIIFKIENPQSNPRNDLGIDTRNGNKTRRHRRETCNHE